MAATGGGRAATEEGHVTGTTTRPGLGRRLVALAVILIIAGVVVVTVLAVFDRPFAVALELALMLLAVAAVWEWLTRTGGVRWVWGAVAAAAVVAVLALQLAAGWTALVSLLVRLALLGVAVALARVVLGRDTRSLAAGETPGVRAPAAARGTLIMNLKSGGGKAERFRLVEECRARGVEPVVLQPGDDLLRLAHEAVDRGADVIGMAGGDGSQALVASVAAERGVPMVVVPAGTRNHFALDIGLDRDDVVGALDAYGEAVERRLDLADVNGRVFVNNVSLGLYAEIVSSPEYRDHKREITLESLPEMLGPGSEPFDLRFAGPDGETVPGAHVLQVSNDPYGTTATTMTSRPSVGTGLLGVFSLVVPDAAAATRFVAALAALHPELYDGFRQWSVPVFEVTSAGPVAVGLDGEALQMDPPLVFASRPGVLRLRLPARAIGYSPAARAVGVRGLLGLWKVVLGRPVPMGG